jgi:threonine synthase
MSIWRWAEWLAPIPPEARITLGEGNTPLLRSRSIGPKTGLRNLFFKLETVNPSGSYKDRFAATAVSHLRATGRSRCLATSSGNTGAALAAYCAAADVPCEIAIVETAPVDKLKQMLAYGANLYRVRGFGLDPDITSRVFARLQERGQRSDTALLISAYKYAPAGMSGVETLSFELADQSEGPIPHVFCCAGGGGLALGVARGFARLRRERKIDYRPAIQCVQPAGNATIAGPLRAGAARAVDVTCTTSVSGLQVPNVIDGDETLAACRESGGTGHLVEDAFVWEVQRRLAREEGIFCEPAAAVPLAGALQAQRDGLVKPEENVVCLVTGSGFKDAHAVDRMITDRSCPLIELSELEGRQ